MSNVVKSPLHFYNYDKIFSFNAMFMFIIGGRGLGKTYGAKKKAIQKFFKTGEEFIYLRRYRTEMVAKNSFFDDLIAEGEFPEYDFRVFGRYAQYAPKSTADDKQRKWIRMGYFIALSTAQHQKSIAYPLVKTIIYDEFIIETGNIQYLKNEVRVLEGFLLTVDRNKDKTRVIFCANSVSIINPYFLEYKIEPQDGDEFIIKRDGFIVVHIPESKDFQEDVYQTRIGAFLQGGDHAEYAVGNKFADNHLSLIGEKSSNMRYKFTLESPRGIFSVWSYGGKYYCQEKRPKVEKIFTLDARMMGEGKKLADNRDKLIQFLRTAYRTERMTFDKQVTRNIFIEVFTRR